MPSPERWAHQVFGAAILGDQRRTQRLIKIAAVLAAKPLSSFCQSYQNWADIKASYRLIENGKISIEQFQAPSKQATVSACRGQPVVLAVADTTCFNFTNRRTTEGLGPIYKKNGQGIHFHSTLALRPDGVPLGVLRQEPWARDPKEYGKKHQRKKKPIEDKESYRWVKSVIEGSQAMDVLDEEERPYVIHIFDREGDIYEVFEAVRQMGDGAIIRSSWNRCTKDPCGYLQDQVLKAPVLGKNTIDVPRKQMEPKRQACVTYRACSVTLNPATTKKMAIELNVVAVIEEGPSKGIDPLKWILLTTEPIEVFQDVMEIVRLYKLRWHIEEFHLILKSGCRIEKIQFETAERIIKLLAILAAVACRILHLTYLARTNPDLSCTEVLTEHEWRALQTQIQGKPPLKKTHPPSLKQAVLWIGRLGGHIGRKSDGMPGVRSLWKGWRDLQLLTTMFIACNTGFNQLN